MNKLGQYRKSIAALIGSILTWAGAAYIPTGHVDRAEWYVLAVALASAAGVYSVSNSPATQKAPHSSASVTPPPVVALVSPAAETVNVPPVAS